MLNYLSVDLRLTMRKAAAYTARMLTIVEMVEADPTAPACCDCRASMKLVGIEQVPPSRFVWRSTFECACGTIMIDDASLH